MLDCTTIAHFPKQMQTKLGGKALFYSIQFGITKGLSILWFCPSQLGATNDRQRIFSGEVFRWDFITLRY
jgi:hypothetical protein